MSRFVRDVPTAAKALALAGVGGSWLDALAEGGLVDRKAAESVLREAGGDDEQAGELLVEKGLTTRRELLMARAESAGLPYIELGDYRPNMENRALLPEELARSLCVFPLFRLEQVVTLAVRTPLELARIDQIRIKCGCEVEQCLAGGREILNLIDMAYGAFAGGEKAAADAASMAWDDILKDVSDSPAVKLVDVLLDQAIGSRASDIHIDATEQTLFVRFRIDGVLREVPAPPKSLLPAVVSRIKIMGRMDIAETRKPQDGRIKIGRGGREIDVRVSTLPSVNGEAVVMRLLNAGRSLLTLEELGLAPDRRDEFDRLIHVPHGMVLVTGPTGSGKTTTLYSSLTRLDRVRQSVITLEDPVEIRLPQIRQVAVNPKAGLTFEGGLRSILRQDPDCIMLGEIRDQETAEIALQAALTGHLVLSTLHTNSAAGAVARLKDMGAAGFLVASALLGVLAQRLCRRLCPHCARPGDPGNAEFVETLERLGIGVAEAGEALPRVPAGCKRCGGTGYDGRVGVFELLVVNDEIRRAILEEADSGTIAALARADGTQTLFEDGLTKVRSGVTSPQELLRVIGRSDRRAADRASCGPAKSAAAAEPLEPFDAGEYQGLLRRWLSADAAAPAGGR